MRLSHRLAPVSPAVKRSLSRCGAAGVLIATSLVLTACGSGAAVSSTSRSGAPPGSPVSLTASPTHLNTAKIAHAIEQSSLAQRGKRVKATCPTKVAQKKGLVFYCTAVYQQSRTPFMVTELDGSGHVHYLAR